MSAVVEHAFSSQPSQPQEGESHHLPPRSYAEVAVEGIERHAEEVPHQTNGEAYPTDVNGSAKVNGWSLNIDKDYVLYDKHISPDGEKLTSIKPETNYEKGLKHDVESAPKQQGRSRNKQDHNNAKLASGRRAGAGWQRSA